MELEMESEILPNDLVLEIVARARCSTASTIIRCAATSKPLRRGILNPAFLRRLRGVIHGGDDDVDGRHHFVPPLLLGLFYLTQDARRQLAFVPADADANLPPSLTVVCTAPPGNDVASVVGSYLPVASCRSLLVLRRRCKTSSQDELHRGESPVELSVCNPASGERWVLPPHEVFDATHVLLDVNHDTPPGAGSSFKLLVAQLPESTPPTLIVQLFCSEERGWGAPLACTIAHACHFDGRPKPVVLRGDVHWLCGTYVSYRILKWERRGGGGGEPKTSLLKLPPSCESGLQPMCLALSPPPLTGGNNHALLSVLVLGRDHVVVWIITTTARGRGRWAQRHVIDVNHIARPMDFPEGWWRVTDLRWFCEGSGTIFLQWGNAPLLLNLDSMVVNKLGVVAWKTYPQPEFCPYEVDLTSYMQFVMKKF